MKVIEHHIQREIIDRLMHVDVLRFKELRPDGMESNIFMYHLKQLIKQDFIAKTDTGYTLTPPGLQYVDNFSSKGNKPFAQPKTICILLIKNKAGEIVVAQRKIQPFIRAYMLPSGKQRLDESIEQHVRRELQEKFTVNSPAKRRGVAEIMIYDKPSKMLLTHVVGQVYEVVVDALDIPQGTDRYTYTWCDNPDEYNFLPGTQELIQKLSSTSELFFFSYSNLE